MTRVAAIDCGTNSIRLLVADLPDDPAQPLHDVVRRMEIVRLGQGVDATGRLAPEAIERTRLALAGYAEELRQLGAQRVRMVATSATRHAGNAGEFRDMVLATLGVAPDVVSGAQEAGLSFAGAVRGLPSWAPPPYLVADIGGGSTELVRGSTELVRGSTVVDASISVDIGCVRMTERYLTDDPPGAGQVAAARAHIEATVDRALVAVGGTAPATLIGLAGSVTTVTALALKLDRYRPELVHHARISADQVAEVTEALLAMDRAQRLALPVMHPGRADVIAAGALILLVLMRRCGAASVVASEHDILDGIADSLR